MDIQLQAGRSMFTAKGTKLILLNADTDTLNTGLHRELCSYLVTIQVHKTDVTDEGVHKCVKCVS